MSTAVEPPIRAELHLQTICLSVLTVVAVGFALWWLRPVMIPFVVAAFLAFGLLPLVDWLEVWVRVPRTSAVCLVLILAVMVLLLLGFFVAVSVGQIYKIAAQYQAQLEEFLERLAQALPLDRLGIDRQKIIDPLTNMPEGTVENVLLSTTVAVWGVVSQSGIVLLFLFFLLLSSVKRDRPIGGAWGEMESRIRGYIITMTTLSAVTGVLVGATLSIFGVQAAVLFGLLTFLLNFIPNVGSFISILLPIPIIWLSPDLSLAQRILAVLIPAALQFAIGNFIQPRIMGESMKLHPVMIVGALIFWGMLWGIVGAFLAVPITSIIRIACDRHPLTKPVAKLMAGRLDPLREEPIVVPDVAQS